MHDPFMSLEIGTMSPPKHKMCILHETLELRKWVIEFHFKTTPHHLYGKPFMGAHPYEVYHGCNLVIWE
jgi:hypothetical protein